MNSSSTTNPRRTGAQEQVVRVPGYLRVTKSSQQKQRPRVGQTTNPKPPAPKKNASSIPQCAVRPSTPKPFNPSKTGSQVARASPKGATPTSAKRRENRALASTIESITSAEPSPLRASRPRAASRDTPTPVFGLLEPQYLSCPPLSLQTPPSTPPNSPPQSPPQPTEYPLALKHGHFDTASIYQRRSRASRMTPPQSPKNSPKPEHGCIDTAAIYSPEGNVGSYRPRAGPRRMVLAASHDSQADKDLLAVLDAPTLDPIESLGWDSKIQLDEVSLAALIDMCDVFKSYGLEHELISAAHS
ncbi:unnamed protein product [Rhizoctonia solani]|uniref:Uncharacterized protein n=1 Tax=Rhizoctonia solani TaxID=456999 RepID=A0A8H2ZZX0_9AGAM|nr:unnamed protein product [Rhizoctonia solani]